MVFQGGDDGRGYRNVCKTQNAPGVELEVGGLVCGGTHSAAKHGLICIYACVLKRGGPPADGGHPGGRRTGGHPGGRWTGVRCAADGHTCSRYGGRGGTEGAPTWRQGKVHQQTKSGQQTAALD
jgi:hypothetical protein